MIIADVLYYITLTGNFFVVVASQQILKLNVISLNVNQNVYPTHLS